MKQYRRTRFTIYIFLLIYVIFALTNSSELPSGMRFSPDSQKLMPCIVKLRCCANDMADVRSEHTVSALIDEEQTRSTRWDFTFRPTSQYLHICMFLVGLFLLLSRKPFTLCEYMERAQVAYQIAYMEAADGRKRSLLSI